MQKIMREKKTREKEEERQMKENFMVKRHRKSKLSKYKVLLFKQL